MQKYRFIGDGAGIPGLPREITQADLDAMTETERAEIQEALDMGLYIEINVGTDPAPSEGE